jgi:anti-sigma factor RsiW
MTTKFTCDDKATLISYLYGELDAAAKQAVDDHVAQCATCAAEVTALGNVRWELGLWSAPEADLDFAVVKKADLASSNVLRPARWWHSVPLWAQAAAAILVVAAGASIANLQIKSGPDGFSVSTGWMQHAAEPPTANGPGVAPAALSATAEREAIGRRVEGQLASLERKLRDEIRASRDQNATRIVATSDDGATLRQVRQLIADAERRHSQELAARFIEFTNDLNMQRRADMMTFSRAITAQDAQMLRQRQMINTQGQLINNAIRVTNNQQ